MGVGRGFCGGKTSFSARGGVVAWRAPILSAVRVVFPRTLGAVGGLDLLGWHWLHLRAGGPLDSSRAGPLGSLHFPPTRGGISYFAVGFGGLVFYRFLTGVPSHDPGTWRGLILESGRPGWDT